MQVPVQTNLFDQPFLPDFLSSSLTWLWGKVDSTLSGVSKAAYTAISSFPPESTTLRMLPEYARTGLRLPAR